MPVPIGFIFAGQEDSDGLLHLLHSPRRWALFVFPDQYVLCKGLWYLNFFMFIFNLERNMPDLLTTTLWHHVRKGVFKDVCMCVCVSPYCSLAESLCCYSYETLWNYLFEFVLFSVLWYIFTLLMRRTVESSVRKYY